MAVGPAALGVFDISAGGSLNDLNEAKIIELMTPRDIKAITKVVTVFDLVELIDFTLQVYFSWDKFIVAQPRLVRSNDLFIIRNLG